MGAAIGYRGMGRGGRAGAGAMVGGARARRSRPGSAGDGRVSGGGVAGRGEGHDSSVRFFARFWDQIFIFPRGFFPKFSAQ